MSESIKQLRRVAGALAGLKEAVEGEQAMTEELRQELIGLCNEMLAALGAGGGDGYSYPEPKKPVKTTVTAGDVERQKSFTGSLAGHFFGH